MPSPADARWLLATRSADKRREIVQILAPFTRAAILSLDDAGVLQSEVEEGIEQHDTFLANAHAKAAFFLAETGLATIADDSGICVDALGGKPGVYSRRFADTPAVTGPEQDRANNEKLLRILSDVAPGWRGAHYTCAAVLHFPDGRRAAAVGTCSGFILEAPRGDHGFGYDPLFLDLATGLSFGETDPATKNRRSHRARAFRALAANLPAT
jgi:XTP/dITP diphosphohydrolase